MPGGLSPIIVVQCPQVEIKEDVLLQSALGAAILDTHRLITLLRIQEIDHDETATLQESLFTKKEIIRHTLILEAAVDAHSAAHITKQRSTN